MPGIIHKESLPGQSFIKRRRVDTQTVSDAQKEGGHGNNNDKRLDEAANDLARKDNPLSGPEAPSGSLGSTAKSSAIAEHARGISSSSDSSSSDVEDGGNDEIERENERLAKLREQRGRRQQERGNVGTAAAHTPVQPSAKVPCSEDMASSPPASKSKVAVVHTNGYDHDVLFREAAWRNRSRAATVEERRKQKWDSVLNRTQDSEAFGHFMKNYFK
ncbi:hypothetical protein JKF63_02152 [Porcisia hertigi]|uniref:Uncharacterized protein n=1 Tax=Porcisia hertigi TaxID=2761500 RepID=A0A836HL11_9TRYP|nr:hypothetical protein JKF63_02144 [Porcisia hertigi]KAG5495099.1 hypothetical protein JKF63_02152 [Porcisia hertigi]